jgi:hypothetical protein
MKFSILIFSFALSISTQAQSAQEILQKSIAYHDPNNEWKSLKSTFYFTETRPDGPDRKTIFTLDNARNEHTLNRNNEEVYEIKGPTVKVVKGSGASDKGLTLRNYYVYLWGLPMKLNDQGTSLSSNVGSKTVEGKVCHVLTVKYEKETWTYFIVKNFFALQAYGFKKTDGTGKEEYISLKGEANIGTMRIPKARSWYDMPTKKFLGTDTLEKAE